MNLNLQDYNMYSLPFAPPPPALLISLRVAALRILSMRYSQDDSSLAHTLLSAVRPFVGGALSMSFVPDAETSAS